MAQPSEVVEVHTDPEDSDGSDVDEMESIASDDSYFDYEPEDERYFDDDWEPWPENHHGETEEYLFHDSTDCHCVVCLTHGQFIYDDQ